MLTRTGKSASKRNFSTSRVSRKTPLSEFFPGTPEFTESYTAKPAQIKVTKLDNGLTVITKNSFNSPITKMSLFVDAGSRFENNANAGVSHFIAQLGFKDTTKSSELLRVRLLESTGGNFSVAADRENIVYTMEGLSPIVPTAVTDMFESLYPRLHRLDVAAERDGMKAALEDALSSPTVVLNEALHQTAFGNSGLGNALFCPPHNVSLSNKAIVEYMNKHYQPNRMTLVALDYDHDKLVHFAQEAIGGEKTTATVEKSASEYVGGVTMLNELRVAHPEEELRTQVALGFQGVSHSSADAAAAAVLQATLGGGATIYQASNRNSGSKLSSVTESAGILTSQAFNINYSDNGLFGVHALLNPAQAHKGILALAQSLASTASGVSEADLARAKKVAKFNIFSTLEQRSAQIDALYRTHTTGKDVSSFEGSLASQIDGVTLSDVKRVAENIFKSKVTYVAHGDLGAVPSLKEVAAQLS